MPDHSQCQDRLPDCTIGEAHLAGDPATARPLTLIGITEIIAVFPTLGQALVNLAAQLTRDAEKLRPSVVAQLGDQFVLGQSRIAGQPQLLGAFLEVGNRPSVIGA
jgi:hypothetical protein